MRLKDKVVIVTASTRGIGLATVKACAKEGAIVYMAARNREVAEKEVTKMNEEGGRVKFVYNDASVKESFFSMVDEVVKNALEHNVTRILCVCCTLEEAKKAIEIAEKYESSGFE